MRASVHVKLPKVSARDDFKKVCDEMKLQIRGIGQACGEWHDGACAGIHGEHSESAGGVYDISNKERLGLTEFEAVKRMYEGVAKLIEMEKTA